MYSSGPPHMAEQKQDDQLEHTYSSYVRIRDVALKTCWRRWTIERSGERGSGISVLAARHDDDDNDWYILVQSLLTCWWNFLLLIWNILLCLYCLTLSRYLLSLPSFANIFWFVFSSCTIRLISFFFFSFLFIPTYLYVLFFNYHFR